MKGATTQTREGCTVRQVPPSPVEWFGWCETHRQFWPCEARHAALERGEAS